MNPRISRFRPLPFVLVAFVVLFGGACAQPASPPASNASAPPTDSSEQTVRSSDGRAAAQLIVSATRIRPHDRVKVYIENQGEVALNVSRTKRMLVATIVASMSIIAVAALFMSLWV